MGGAFTRIAGGGIIESVRNNYRVDAFESILNYGAGGVHQNGIEGGVINGENEQIDTLLVTKVEGAFDQNNENVEQVIPGREYMFKATFSAGASAQEIKKLRWGFKKNDGEITSISVDYSSLESDSTFVNLHWILPQGSYEEIVVYAYFQKADDAASVICETKDILPIYVDRFRIPGKDETGQQIADDMAYGNGEVIPGQSVYSTDQILSLGKLMWLTSKYPDSILFIDFRIMARGIFSRGELNDNIERMIAKFENNEGGIYEDEVLTRHAAEHESTQRFCVSIEDEIAERLKQGGGDILAVEDTRVHFTDHSYGHPRFNTLEDTFAGGLTIAVNDVWSYEIQLTRFEQNGDNYNAAYKVTLFDHFGLDMPDMEKKYYYMEGFRAWFVLQHLRNYKPFITKIEFEREFEGNIKEGRNERITNRG